MESIFFANTAQCTSELIIFTSTRGINNLYLIAKPQHERQFIDIFLLHSKYRGSMSVFLSRNDNTVCQNKHSLRCSILGRTRQHSKPVYIPFSGSNAGYLIFTLRGRNLIHVQDWIIRHQLLLIPHRNFALLRADFNPQPHGNNHYFLTNTETGGLHNAIQKHDDILRAFLLSRNACHVITRAYCIHHGTRMQAGKISRHIDPATNLTSLATRYSLIGYKRLKKQHGFPTLLFLHQPASLLKLIRSARPEREIVCSNCLPQQTTKDRGGENRIR